MNFVVTNEQFTNVSEIWEVGPNTIEVVMGTSHKRFRITAQRNIRSGATPPYFASYEEQVELTVGGKTVEVWASANFPWQDGNTIEECIRGALRWVNNPR